MLVVFGHGPNVSRMTSPQSASSRFGRKTAALAATIALAVGVSAGAAAIASLPAEAASRPVSTKAEYDKIKKGQSDPEVTEIIGGKGQRIGGCKIGEYCDGPGGGIAKVQYDNYDWRSTGGASVGVTFVNGKVSTKERYGQSTVTTSEYKHIRKGMSYAKVKSIAGGPADFRDGTRRYWSYDDNKRWVVIKFKSGKVSTKSLKRY